MSDKKLVVWPYFLNAALIILAVMGGFMDIRWAENLAIFCAIVMGTLLLLCIIIVSINEDAASQPDKKAPGSDVLLVFFPLILAASGHLIAAIYVFIPGLLFRLMCKKIQREKAQS